VLWATADCVANVGKRAFVTEICVGTSAVRAQLIYFFATEGSNEGLNARENISSRFH
jgi:hypothetical protein